LLRKADHTALLRTTSGMDAEPGGRNFCLWNGDQAPHGYSSRGNLGDSVFRCVLWLNNTSYSNSAWRSEQDVPSRNTTVQLSTPYTPILSATIHIVTDRQMDRR